MWFACKFVPRRQPTYTHTHTHTHTHTSSASTHSSARASAHDLDARQAAVTAYGEFLKRFEKEGEVPDKVDSESEVRSCRWIASRCLGVAESEGR